MQIADISCTARSQGNLKTGQLSIFHLNIEAIGDLGGILDGTVATYDSLHKISV